MEKLTVEEPFFAIFVVSRPYHVLRSERGPARERKTGYVLFDSNMSSISLYNILHIENVNITIKYAYGHTTQNKENLSLIFYDTGSQGECSLYKQPKVL